MEIYPRPSKTILRICPGIEHVTSPDEVNLDGRDLGHSSVPRCEQKEVLILGNRREGSLAIREAIVGDQPVHRSTQIQECG
jgi:hypothetical protein